MAERTSYPPGTFSWSELVTRDAGAAKDFYATAFGWDYEDMPVGEGQVYTMARRDGKDVAALYSSEDQPPHWNCYVTVASADQSATRAAELGGTVVQEPFDVMDAGRMTVIADPTGAALCLWEPRANIGADLVNAPGSLTWDDLITPDPDRAAAFFGELFGWTTEEEPESGGYRVIQNGGRENGGIMPGRQGGPPSWIPYFGHDDVGRLVGEIPGLGGQVFNGPVQMWQGKIAVLGDPQGAVFAVWTGHYDD